VKVFLDVGANDGGTLYAVRDPKYSFDRIYCFEPASICWPKLEAVRDGRVRICKFGLWNITCDQVLYAPGSGGASLFEEKFREEPSKEVCRFVRASDWFRENLRPDDEIFLKLNCEGAECDIAEDLLDSTELARVRSVMIDPDVRKIRSLAHREQELCMRLAAAGLQNCFMREDVMVGATHHARIQNWLSVANAEERTVRTRLLQGAYVAAEALHGRRRPLRTTLESLIRRPRSRNRSLRQPVA
jgi:FkbM family methyltransferase